MFKLEIDIENDAFQPGPESALHEILIKVAQRVREGATSGRVTDPNGNYVGDFSYETDRARAAHEDFTLCSPETVQADIEQAWKDAGVN